MSQHESALGVDDHGASDAHGAGRHDSQAAHGGSIKTYLAVFVTLCVLTTGSFMTYFPIWRTHFSAHAGWAFMMAISCSKAMLVILFFMHLKYEANWKYVLTIPAGFMSIFLVLMLVPDVGLRRNHYSEERREFSAVAPSHEAPSGGQASPPGDRQGK